MTVKPRAPGSVTLMACISEKARPSPFVSSVGSELSETA